jgi:hypothetical protein
MKISATETPIEIPGSMTNQGDLQGSPSDCGSVEILDHTALEQLTEKSNYCGFLDGKDAEVYGNLMTVQAPPEKSIDIPSLLSKLFSLLPGDRQLERRARKLAWHLSKGRKVTCEWDNVFLSELTPAENRMSDDEFVALYPDQVKTPTKKGGRPKKYRTAKAQKRGHAERQRRYRERKLIVVADVTKTPSQLAER